MEKLNYEDATKRLEEICALLEQGSTSLASGVKLFEEAQQLIKFCQGELDSAKGKLTSIKQEFDKLTEE